MSNLERDSELSLCGGRAGVAVEPVRELLSAREVTLGESTTVRRLLPHRRHRMVGAWCFVDHYGPDDIASVPGMQVAPHPHIGLQTVSWLIEGEVLHRDNLGSEQMIRPGQLNLMTAGRAIAHSEESPREHQPTLHGVQLWVALPDGHRDVDPCFDHHPSLPVITDTGTTVTVLAGELAGVRSPARCFSPLVGADASLDTGAETRLPLEPDFEYAVLAQTGTAWADGVPVAPGSLLYLGCGRRDLALRTPEGPGRVLLLGGEPFGEQIVMWWNFVARTGEEIAAAREDWMTGRRFGTVTGYDGDPIPAPALPATPLKPRGAHR